MNARVKPALTTRGQPVIDRFFAKVERREANDCWLWQAYKIKFGYGLFYFRGGIWKAHRVSWVLANGEIPDNKWVLHRCDIPACVNPGHLFLGTHADNVADMISKGRYVNVGVEVMGKIKLTPDQVRAIRASDETALSVARRFSIVRSTVYRIRNRKYWSQIT